ncbi:MAG: glutamine--tRNA ligase [Planctomycetaceae bacterium]|nr:glutamine--tRNA ligase [Planctomycetaceae bacterium]
MSETPTKPTTDFIRQAINEDLAAGRYDHVITRFPPEPNAYLHIGHAKAMGVDFGIAADYDGSTNLRFDDTNPVREEQEYVDAIKEDVAWLGYQWQNECYASDYFEQYYHWAVALIGAGLAYVDDQTADEIRATRGTLTEPGTPSPHRDRGVEENLSLFDRMKAGEFPDGSRVLRAKIDMAAPNMNLRDPVMYRILHMPHPHTGDAWCIYPMYDWAHGEGDWVEGVTHSLCTMEFEDHRPLYDWYIARLSELDVYPPNVDYLPRQIEFARGNITYMVTSKRRLLELVDQGYVKDWDDPRMPTLRGLRRRGVTPEAIRRFWDEAGIAKRDNNIEFAKLESVLRDDLNRRAARRMAVLRPLKVVITNYPEGQTEHLSAVNNPEDESAGARDVPFGRELYVERDDFMEDPPRKFFRLAPGREVRLRYAYLITCTDVIKDGSGQITELHCTYDPETRGGNAPDGRKVKATIHWVSAADACDAEVRLYDHLFTTENPLDVPDGTDWLENLNPNSLEVITDAKLEPSLAEPQRGEPVQFERLGYFVVDPDTTADRLVFNRTATLRDSFAKAKGAK